jgi:hypothetical protein
MALKREAAHTVNPPVRAGFFSTDYLDIVERLAAYSPVRRSENVDRTHQIHLPHGRESEEHNAFSLNIGSHGYCLLITEGKVEIGDHSPNRGTDGKEPQPGTTSFPLKVWMNAQAPNCTGAARGLGPN